MFQTRVSIFTSHFARCAKEGCCFSLPMESGVFTLIRRISGGGLRLVSESRWKRLDFVSCILKEWSVRPRLAFSFSRTPCYRECRRYSEIRFVTCVSEQCGSSMHTPAPTQSMPMHASSFASPANSVRIHMNPAKEFYDHFGRKLLGDYASNNPRMASAISFVVAQLSRHRSTRILDIGCGIGWSCHEIIRALPASSVQGIDLSPALINLAKRLFADERIRFDAADVTQTDWKASCVDRYDACVLVDVLEHIPKNSRTTFIASLEPILQPRAVVMLSCPTVYHQQYLRAHDRAGLQPIDEDVSLPDLQQIAGAMGGEVTYFEYKSVWRPNDYFHAAIERGHEGDYLERSVPVSAEVTLEPGQQRARRLREAVDVIGNAEVRKLAMLAAPPLSRRLRAIPSRLAKRSARPDSTA